MNFIATILAEALQDHADHIQAIWLPVATIVIGAFVSWVTARLTLKSDERRAIREENMRLIEWAIEYPFLESDEFCGNWPNCGRSEDDRMRYDNYCCHVFNVLQHAWEFHKGERRLMYHTLYAEELIARHRTWWSRDELNQKGYPVEFRQFVAEILRELNEGNGK